MSRIVVLDGYTLNPGDLSWEPLEQIGECSIYERTPAEKIVERAQAAEIVLTNKTPLSKQSIDRLPNLKYIGVLATGYNIVDIAAAGERDIVVANVPTYGTASVAQMVFAHLLNLTQRVGDHAASVRDGAWTRCPDFCYWNTPLEELSGKTLGLVGLGRIGVATAEIGLAFGMQVLAHDPFVSETPKAAIALTDLDDLFRRSDVVSIHCPLTADNGGMVDAERLSRMKSTAMLINTSRGPLVDEQALADALNSGRIAGAGLDVLSVEPPAADNPLIHAKNCFITPHIAWATHAARSRLLGTAIDNVRAYLSGRPANVVHAA
jgi:glycerate dehydrogenase